MLVELHILNTVEPVDAASDAPVLHVGNGKRAWVSCHTLKHAFHRRPEERDSGRDRSGLLRADGAEPATASPRGACPNDESLSFAGRAVSTESALALETLSGLFDPIAPAVPGDDPNAPEAGCRSEERSEARSESSKFLELALFGSETRSTLLGELSPAVQMAHALSTHEIQESVDFFCAADSLSSPQTSGANRGDAGQVILYRYCALDTAALGRNLKTIRACSERESRDLDALLAQTLTFFLLRMAAMPLTTDLSRQPAAPDAILAEMKPFPVPISYAGAFTRPVDDQSGLLLQASLRRLVAHADAVNSRYHLMLSQRVLFAPNYPGVAASSGARAIDLPQFISVISQAVQHGN